MIEGLTFNDKHCSVLGLIMDDSRRPVLPESRDNYKEVPHRDSSVLIPDPSIADVFVEVDFTLVEDTTTSLRAKARLIGAWLSTLERKPLIFDDDPTYIYQAKLVSGLTIDQITDFDNIGEFTVIFRCSLPQIEVSP